MFVFSKNIYFMMIQMSILSNSTQEINSLPQISQIYAFSQDWNIWSTKKLWSLYLFIM